MSGGIEINDRIGTLTIGERQNPLDELLCLVIDRFCCADMTCLRCFLLTADDGNHARTGHTGELSRVITDATDGAGHQNGFAQ